MGEIKDLHVHEFFEDFKKDYFNWNVSKGPVEINEPLCNIKDEKKYLFSQQVEAIDRLLEEFHKNLSDNMITKNIGVIGGRGSGKTSFLRTFKHSIECEEYFVFDIVDPNILGSSINVLEILISLIYGEINEYVDFSKDDLVRKQAKILKRLKEISETLSNLRKKENYFRENNPPIDVLDDIHTRIKFNSKFEELIEEFKEFLEVKEGRKIKDVILMIDDLDLIKNKEVYEMLNDIQNFLNGNIILMLGYREEQLLSSVLEQKIIENKILIDEQQIGYEDIKIQSINMIDKLIPYNNRVNLNIKNDLFTMDKLLEEVLKKEYRSYIDGEVLKAIGKIKVEVFFEEAIMYKINLPTMPIDSKEYTKYIFPENLRGKLQLLELIVKEMENHNNDSNNNSSNNKKELYEIYNKNLKLYKEYFYSTLRNTLENTRVQVIDNWVDTPVEKKNYYIYKVLFDEITKLYKEDKNISNKREGLNLLDINEIQTYNICIGDIHGILEVYKNIICKGELDYYYIYSIKMIYSIELLGYYISAIEMAGSGEVNLLKSNKYNMEDNLSNYLKLINVRIMPDRMIYFNLRKSLFLYYNKEYNDYIWKIHYSDLSLSGQILENARPIFNGSIMNSSSNQNQYKYREAFNYMELGETIHNKVIKQDSKIGFDPYSFVGKYKYVLSTIESYNKQYNLCAKKDNLGEKIRNLNKNIKAPKNDYYIFYSLFDIDIFLRLVYISEDTKDTETFRSIANKINRFMGEQSEMTIPLEKELKSKLDRYSFKYGNSDDVIKKPYNYPYTEMEIKNIQALIEENTEKDRISTDDIIKSLLGRIQANQLDGSKLLTNSIDALKEINRRINDNILIKLKSDVEKGLSSSNKGEGKKKALELIYDKFEYEYDMKDLLSAKNINLKSKSRFCYGLYIIIKNSKKLHEDNIRKLEEYILFLMEYIEEKKGLATRDYEKTVVILLITLGITDFNSDIYTYRNE